MASGLSSLLVLLLLLHICTSSQLDPASHPAPHHRWPHLSGCVSANMETFHCGWNVGTFRNLSGPGELRLFYMSKKPSLTSPTEWSECPHYTADPPNQCFFNENHTSIWTYYSVQLRSRDQTAVYDENLFYVQDIVKPDPPVDLHWTLLNVSVTGASYDIMLSWKPPQSADVEMGWMTLQYEVHYRDVTSDLWNAVDPVKSTHRSLYGLQTNVNHQVRVRCKMLGGKDFGEFSSSVFVHIPSKVSRFPVVGLLVFGALCLVAILMLVLISQQEKLMFLLLPPVPGPKIRGIDPELLKKGKLRELTSILDAPPDLRPELYIDDPWVEFIDLDMEEQTDRLTELGTDGLVDRSPSSNCSALSIGFRDDDSGRASCCDPDLPVDPEVSPFHLHVPDQSLGGETVCPGASETCFLLPTPTAADPCDAAAREALYTQVSEVRSSGKVLLSPEEQSEEEKHTCCNMAAKEKEQDFALLVVNADHGGYTSEVNAGKLSPRSSTGEPSDPCQTGGQQRSSLLPDYKSDSMATPPLPPAPVYTVVEAVDRQNGLVLTPNTTPAPPQLTIPKPMPTPDCYLTPDLLGSVTP